MNVSQVFTTLVLFSTVMMVLSLLITFAVRAIHYLGNIRGATLGEMVGTLNVGYRRQAGEEGAETGDPASAAFVVDVLTYPALHPGKKLVGKSPKDTPKTIRAKRRKMSQSLEYIAKDDLIAIVCRLSGVVFVAGEEVPEGMFPARWGSISLPQGGRSLRSLVSYLDDFFETAEGVSSDTFTASAKRLTQVLACLIVVSLNMDAFRLAGTLYASNTSAAAATLTANQILPLAQRTSPESSSASPPVSRDSLLNGQTKNVEMLTSILDQPAFGLGWQHSWLAQAWCVAQKECPPGTVEVPITLLGWAWGIFSWLIGLVTSCILLSMGAPFWAQRLEQLLGWQTAVERLTGDAANGQSRTTAAEPPSS